MSYPYFFTMRNAADKVRVDHLFNDSFEFNIQFQNGVTDQFIYNPNADEIEKGKLVQGNHSRIEAIQHFEKHLKEVI